MQLLTHQSRNGQLYQVPLFRQCATDHASFLWFTSLWCTHKGSHVIEGHILSLKGLTCAYSQGVPRASFYSDLSCALGSLSSGSIPAWPVDGCRALSRSLGGGDRGGGCSWLLMPPFSPSLPPTLPFQFTCPVWCPGWHWICILLFWNSVILLGLCLPHFG